MGNLIIDGQRGNSGSNLPKQKGHTVLPAWVYQTLPSKPCFTAKLAPWEGKNRKEGKGGENGHSEA